MSEQDKHPARDLRSESLSDLKTRRSVTTRDLRRDRPNVFKILGLHAFGFKRLAESFGDLFFRCYSTCYSSSFTSFSLGF